LWQLGYLGDRQGNNARNARRPQHTAFPDWRANQVVQGPAEVNRGLVVQDGVSALQPCLRGQGRTVVSEAQQHCIVSFQAPAPARFFGQDSGELFYGPGRWGVAATRVRPRTPVGVILLGNAET